jgi:hypothetical protein
MVERLDVQATTVARKTVCDVLDAQPIHKHDHVDWGIRTHVTKQNVQHRSIHDDEVSPNTASGQQSSGQCIRP